MTVEKLTEKEFQLANPNLQLGLFGINDSNLRLLEEGNDVLIKPFGDRIKIEGKADDVATVIEIMRQLEALLMQGIHLSAADIVSAQKMAERGTLEYFQDLYTDTLLKDNRGRAIRVKNYGQRQYIQMIKNNDLTFGIGPAGTGKTYLAVVMAVAALKRHEVDRLILTRPAVEAGESLGFLPGDLKKRLTHTCGPSMMPSTQFYGLSIPSAWLNAG